MKKINIILSAAMLMLAGSITTSCSDFLDKEYDASLSSDKVFSDEAQTRGFLANIYTCQMVSHHTPMISSPVLHATV